MTLAVAGSTSIQHAITHTVPVAILGTDALLAAHPATAVQIAHACLRAGFANVIPASWGDELVAAAVLRRLPEFGSGPAIHCSCPIVAHRLLTVGGDLRPVLLPFVSPPVAIARYVRALSHPARPRITYVGSCPGAADESIDIRMTPDALIAMLDERQIRLDEQPRVFESIVPPDRRRFRSQPGGLPTAEALWEESGARTLVEIDGEDIVAEIAQHLLTGKNVLIDASTRLGCVCSGAIPGVPASEARARVVSLEAPRAPTPIVQERVLIELDSHIPAVSRTPIDIVARPSSAPPHAVSASRGDNMPVPRLSPARAMPALVEPRMSRTSGPLMSRPVMGALPITRDAEGRPLPRAYMARRRLSPRGMTAFLLPPAVMSDASSETPAVPQPALTTPVTSGAWPVPPRQLLYALIAVLVLVIGVSAVVAAVVSGR